MALNSGQEDQQQFYLWQCCQALGVMSGRIQEDFYRIQKAEHGDGLATRVGGQQQDSR